MTAAADTELLADLDWHTVKCQCPGHDCRRRATVQVEIHAVDNCSCDCTNPLGNFVDILCNTCLHVLRAVVEHEAARCAKIGRPYCLTCMSPITNANDVIRGVKPL